MENFSDWFDKLMGVILVIFNQKADSALERWMGGAESKNKKYYKGTHAFFP
jgi:hypothetical protein